MDQIRKPTKMDDVFAQFANSDDLSFVISTTPPDLQSYALAVVDLNEFPLPKSTVEIVDGHPCFHDLHIPFTDGLKELGEIDSNGDIIKQLAKIDGIQQSLKAQHQQNIQTYIGFFAPLRDLPLVEDMTLIRHFSNAGSLASGFSPFAAHGKSINMMPKFTKESQATLQSALACQMAGLTRPAAKLFNEFIEYQLVDMNDGFQWLLESIINEIGRIKTSSKAGKSGRAKKFAISDQVKAYAIQLFDQGDFNNAHHAAHAIVGRVKKYGKSIGFEFSSDYQAPRTIHLWLSKHIKSKFEGSS
ncbi:hypothetical protein KDN34_05085 [Shewanella yunxiaonensis]|uniref:Uncharacterized protein n=1 Tax=Shewanella yunxiaonensis TaxID=2829809 RepID=A0ABX7YVI4_9GAMM|nr:hypothetical protein [Shewanella yunxiaonensis]QUN06827.1 hypothetical protein KDN34_05085 [Shewanella yunxiaonensis]